MAHFTVMVARWGEDFLDFVFAPALADAPSLTLRLERMERRAAQFSRELADLKQQVTHEKVADRRGHAVDAGGGGAGGVAGSCGARGAMVSRAIGTLLLAVFLAAPVLDAIAATFDPPSTVADLLDADDDHAARLPKAPRLARPVRGMAKRGRA